MKFFCVAAFCAVVLVSVAQAQVAPTIASISNSQRVNEGDSLSLTVSVNGTAPFTYVWKKGTTTIASATTNTYTIASVAVSDAGSYTVTISNGSGSVTSGAILIDVTPATAPTFYYQYSSATYTVGDTIDLSAYVSGTSPMTFVWKKDGASVYTGNVSNYLKANAQTTDSGSYTVTATNVAGSATSSAIIVTVSALTAPTFTSQPSDTTVDPGSSASFSCWVANSTGVTFQWYKDDVALPNASSSNFWIWSVTATDAGKYKVVATNAAGSTTSSAATLTVRPPSPPSNLTISSGPLTVTVGDSFSLYSSFSGTAPFTYQWKKDGAAIAGATSSSYFKSNVTADDAGVYTLTVTNTAGSATSSGTSVSVSTAQVPIILTHPTSLTAYPGDWVSLSVNATGTGSLSFQWKKDGVVLSGQTSSWLNVSNAIAASDAGSYVVVVTNAQGSTTSQPAVVTVLPAVAPTITRQPAGISMQPGPTLQLFVEATGHPAPTYQWKKDGVVIAGATNSYYNKSNVASSDSGSYTVVVSNTAGSVTSTSAVVSVGAATTPVIYRHPASASLLLGNGFYEIAVSIEQSSGTVQWYRDNVAVAGATDPTYYIWSADPSTAGTYKAVVTNSAGATTSLDGVITVDLSTARPVITYTSGSQTVSGGATGTATINISPAITSYTVVWKKDGVIVPNATSLSLNLFDFGPSSVGTYTAEVTTGGNTYTSRPVVLALRESGVAPRVTRQPASLTRTVRDSAWFDVVAAGEEPFTYQWKKDGVDIPNATYSTYSLFPVTAAGAGNYTVTITNRNGSTTSNVASLTVSSTSSAPIIANQPTSQTYTAGSSYLSLSVNLLNWEDGTTYQWYKDDVALSGATSASYWSGATITTATSGRYKVKVTNSVGTTTSDEAIITVVTRATGPTFTTQPSNQTAYTGGSVTFTAAATSTSTLSYQWRKNGVAISGATSASLTLNNLQTADAGSYSVLASNADGATASAVAQLTITASVPPTITSQPTSQVGGKGGSASFTVSATGTPAPTYQWKKNGSDIGGATSATLSWSNLGTDDGGNYSVVVTNPGGSVTSNVVSLTVYDQQPFAPSITNQPQSRAYALGESVTLLVGVSGVPAPTIQWYKNGAPVGGGNAESLSLGKMTNEMAGDYHAVATNILGSASSNIAKITVAIDVERLVNVSTRGTAGKDANTLIGGLVISGDTPKNVMIRAIGPSLASLGVQNGLANPQLKLFKGQTTILSNDDWATGNTVSEVVDTAKRLGAFALDQGSKDAVILTKLDPGVYTAHVTTSDSSTGTALLEVYDADATLSSTKVVNLSSRGPVGAGDDILIVGFVVTGNVPKKVLIRGVGPALTARGVTGALADPRLLLFHGTTQIGENDNWSSGTDAADIAKAATTTGAAALDSGSKDAAMLISLAPGVYTAHVRGVGSATGVALVEVYDVP